MEREWEIGTQLRAALEEPGGRLPGFMRMCDCLVHSDDPASGRARFSGMIMVGPCVGLIGRAAVHWAPGG